MIPLITYIPVIPLSLLWVSREYDPYIIPIFPYSLLPLVCIAFFFGGGRGDGPPKGYHQLVFHVGFQGAGEMRCYNTLCRILTGLSREQGNILYREYTRIIFLYSLLTSK